MYSRAHPERASELFQYSHIISMIASQFHWDNVYMYDKDFRLHMARHPERSWAIILQQAWSLRLKDKLNNHNSNNGNYGQGRNGKGNNNKNKEICRRFNRGRCSYGSTCRYEHKCNFCNKYGHPVIHCRKAQAERNERTSEIKTPEKFGSNSNGNK